MRKRRLIPEAVMHSMRGELLLGVPLARAMTNNNVTMSRPAVAKLMGIFTELMPMDSESDIVSIMHASMFPPWLEESGQEQPDDVKYEGFFPYGKWI